jgi:hypothetical protein|tara:strand:- start:984 stop:2618 length:1635 start_codon:yes stop_codon:yes gene_type:complete
MQAQLVAVIPDINIWGDIGISTRQFLTELDVQIETGPSPFGDDYPIGNKIAALGIETDAATTLFLDSDILCLAPLDAANMHTEGLLAKPADFDTFGGTTDQWQLAYAAFDLELPTWQVSSTVGCEPMLPYFNAGVIAVKNGAHFSECWLETARVIDELSGIECKRPWLDQISLPVAAERMGYRSTILSEDYNYPAHNISIKEGKPPVLCHYHWPSVIEHEPVLVRLVGRLAAQFPALEQMIRDHSDWRSLLDSPFLSSNQKGQHPAQPAPSEKFRNDFLVTGLPRSGTSLLCNLVNKLPDTVVINEPEEVFTTLRSENVCHQFDLFYRSIRADIVHGRQITNKISANGEITEDTKLDNTRRTYTPDISRTNFHLGTKNPLAYLTRLRWLCNNHPDMLKIVTIRNPFSTITSWKNSFDHLEQADHRAFPLGALDDPLLDTCQKEMVAEILEQPTATIRRALLWNYLSEMIWRDRDKLILIKYEELISDPLTAMQPVFDALGYTGNPQALISTVRPRSSEVNLKEEDKLAITDLCTQQISHWGYEI